MLQGGENPRYNNVNGVSANAGYVLSDSHATGTLPRSGLEWAFDFYDHGGNTAATGISGFHDVANGVAFLLPCRSGLCGWNAGQGMTLQPFGASINDGYGANLVSALHDTPQTIAIGATKSATAGLTLQSAPAAMQGNGTFSVAGVFRYDGGGFNQVPIWMTGDYSGSNTMVALSYPSASGGPLELGWGVNANRWRYNSGFSLTAGNWYFITCTVQANGATPIAHMWVGVGGSLVDKIAGVSRAATGGTPVQTPNVAATPLVLGFDSVGATHTVKGSYAGLFVYNRALGQSEIGLMYQTVKAKMALRGVTLQ
jgi:hypothetical protein